MVHFVFSKSALDSCLLELQKDDLLCLMYTKSKKISDHKLDNRVLNLGDEELINAVFDQLFLKNELSRSWY